MLSFRICFVALFCCILVFTAHGRARTDGEGFVYCITAFTIEVGNLPSLDLATRPNSTVALLLTLWLCHKTLCFLLGFLFFLSSSCSENLISCSFYLARCNSSPCPHSQYISWCRENTSGGELGSSSLTDCSLSQEWR